MRDSDVRGALLALLALAQGCSAPATGSEGGDVVGGGDNPLVAGNALAPNALAPNALAPNALAPNALAPNALAPNALAPSALSPSAYEALLAPGSTGDLSRMLVKYLVGCALSADQSFSFTWTDTSGVDHEETFLGQLGLAPEWAAGPLSLPHQRLVSACAAARTNYYGVQVELSMRGPAEPLSVVGDEELAHFPSVEGAFWGNLFDSNGVSLRACFKPENTVGSHAWLRDCANGHMMVSGVALPCRNIEIVGSCDDLCEPLDSEGHHYPSCKDPDLGLVSEVITTALPVAPAAGSLGGLRVETTAPTTLTKSACNRLVQTITVTNEGWVTAPQPMLIHTLGAGLADANASTTAGSCNVAGSAVVCTLSDLPRGGAATITVSAAPTWADAPITSNSFIIAPMQESNLSDNVSHTQTELLAPAPASWETIESSFNTTPIPKGNVLWFTIAMDPGTLPPGATAVWALGGHMDLSVNGTAYTVVLPDGKVVLDPAATKASTSYDSVLHRWTTTAPKTFGGNVFVTAARFRAPVDLPGGLAPVTASVHFVSNQAKVKPSWSWSAAVYDTFGKSYEELAVQPTDDENVNPSKNKDHAGTPEKFKGSVVARAKGSGGANYTGAHSGASSGMPEVQASCQ
jgi:hypothetical protein